MHHSHKIHVLAGFGSDVVHAMQALGVTHPTDLRDPEEDPGSVFVALVVDFRHETVGYTKRVGILRDAQRERMLARTLFDSVTQTFFE